MSEEVEAEIAQETRVETQRLAGQDRFATAAAIARQVERSSGIGSVDGRRTAFVASGRSFPDALAVGPAAFTRKLPVLLTERAELPAPTREAIEELSIEHVVVVGGSTVISEEVVRALDDDDTTVERLGGRDRTDTAVQVAEWALRHMGTDRVELLLARGDAFADSLAAAPLAASRDAPILLTRDPHRVSYDLLQFLVNAGGVTERVTAVGGPAALTDRVVQRTAEAAKRPVRTIAYATGAQGDVEADVDRFSEHVDWTLVDRRGWSLNNDYRFSQIADPDQAELRIWLADPATVDAAAPGCDDAWSCRVGDDVYINEDNWDHGTQERNAERGLDAYRHYVVTHEVGHWIGFDHIDCGDYWYEQEGKPAPVMEQQSIDAGPCHVETWPLQTDAPRDPWGEGDESEFSHAYDLYPTGESAPGTSSRDASVTGSPTIDVE